jgi:DNA repair protein RadC
MTLCHKSSYLHKNALEVPPVTPIIWERPMIYEIKVKFTAVEEDLFEPPVRCNKAEACVAYMQGAFDEYPEQEQFWVILLDRKNMPKGRQLVSLGTLTAALAHPREVFRAAIVGGAAAIIAVHQHPSGCPQPSSADLTLTRQLREAAKIIEIDLLDHVIIGRKSADSNGKGFYSFREAGIL